MKCRRSPSPVLSLALLAAACAPAMHGAATPTGGGAPSAKMELRALSLPGALGRGVMMDYIAYDAANGRVWVPAGNTGSVDVIETASDKITRIEGFPTAEMERKGKKRTVGPSSATVGEGVVYIGNRGNSMVCAVDAKELKQGVCGKVDSMPDGLAYVASTREVWVTTPRDQSIMILDAATLSLKDKMKFEGEPEGFVVDDERGLFYTNLEDKDKTLAIDIKQRKVVSTWAPACGEDGPKGLALDHALNILMVACADRIETLDAGHDGKLLSKLDTGPGVDNIDYVEKRHEVYAGAGKAATLTIARLDDKGTLSPIAVTPTAPGARNPVATADGVAYLTDGPEGKILVIAPPR